MANKTISVIVEHAEKRERERIIKLLTDFDNEKYFAWLRTTGLEWEKDYWSFAEGMRLAILLIKGEVND